MFRASVEVEVEVKLFTSDLLGGGYGGGKTVGIKSPDDLFPGTTHLWPSIASQNPFLSVGVSQDIVNALIYALVFSFPPSPAVR